MSVRAFLVPAGVVLGVCWLVGWAVQSPIQRDLPAETPQIQEIAGIAEQVNRHFEIQWKAENLTPAEPAAELEVLRRLSLALYGAIPSIEEIRRFEADKKPNRLIRWTAAILTDRRFADYFAERLARGFVGTEGGQFIVYRRDRFVSWLADELHAGRPYDAIVRQMIRQDGLWTGQPEVNFMTAAFNEGEFDENKLAGRTARAFLGQSMDCAQCHDHFFAEWTQEQFQGLAAFYGQARLSLVGLTDQTKDKKGPIEYRYEKRIQEKGKKSSKKSKSPRRCLSARIGSPKTGSRRERLAAWITHPENRRFERAIVNRVWGLMFGKPYTATLEIPAAVDDIPNPKPLTADFHGDLLDILGRDFREHGCDLRRLILAIAISRPFRLSSIHRRGNFGKLPAARKRLGGVSRDKTPPGAGHWLHAASRFGENDRPELASVGADDQVFSPEGFRQQLRRPGSG